MKHILLAGIIALTVFSGCENECEPETVIICGEPVGSVVATIKDDTVNLCALPRTYFLSVRNTYTETAYDTLDWELPVEAFDIQRRDDIQAVVFKVSEGTHTLRVRGASPSEGKDWSNWNEWTWTLTRVGLE